ncbi:MAG: putative bifunctional diguanylate cyclase/phosphodiesterase [Acidimicrobiales bacterium]
MRNRTRVILVVGVGLIGIAALVGPAAQQGVRAASAVAFIAATTWRLRTSRDLVRTPWVFFAAGGTLVLISAVIRIIHGAIIGVDNPFPSYAEIPAIAGYLCLSAAAHWFRRLRSMGRDPDAIIDALLVTAASAVVVFSALLSEYFRDDLIPWEERVGNGTYNLLGLLMFGLIARLAVGSGVRNGAWRLLVGAVACIITNELFFVLVTVGNEWGLVITSIVSPLAFVLATASVLHPEAAALTARPEYTPPQLSPARLVLLATSLLTVPIALLISVMSGTDADLPVLVAGSVLLALFTLARIRLLFRTKELVSSLNEALSLSGQSLLDSSNVVEAIEASEHAIRAVVADRADFAAFIHGSEPAGRLISSRTGGVGLLSSVEEGEDQMYALVDAQPGDSLITRLELGQDGQFGQILIRTNEKTEHAEQVAFQTMSTQITQAFSSIEAAQSRAEQRLTSLVEQSSDLICVLEDSDVITFASPNVTRVLGYERGEIEGHHLEGFVVPDDWVPLDDLLAAPTPPSETPVSVECRLRTIESEARWFAMTARDFRDDAELGGIVLTGHDITEERNAQAAIVASERRFRSLVQHASDIVIVLDNEGNVEYISDSVEVSLGHGVDAFMGQSLLWVIHEKDRDAGLQQFDSVVSSPGQQERIEFRALHADGSIRLFESLMTDMRHIDEVSGIVLNVSDMTERRSLERDLRDAETIDPLTLQLNRKAFLDEVNTALRRASVTGDAVAIAIIDLDDFKTINDALGPMLADRALVETAQRIRRAVRVGDVVARLSGDEFGVLMPDGYSQLEAVAATERIMAELRLDFSLEGHSVQLESTAGLAMDVGGSELATHLLRSADTALSLAKTAARGQAMMFEESMGEAVSERLTLRAALDSAIDDGGLRLAYQPIISVESGNIVSMEALARWNHAERGNISPGVFIPIAEESTAIIRLGEWALRSACNQVQTWEAEGLDGFTVSVNMSGHQLREDAVISRVATILEETAVDPARIIIEITESVLIDDTDFIAHRIRLLRELGVGLAIDDFGTGYSSLSYLQRYEFDYLKIDRAFVVPLADERRFKEREIVAAIINLARGLGATTVAEGIEGLPEYGVLRTLGCDRAQGFLFHRPMEVGQIADTFQADRQNTDRAA